MTKTLPRKRDLNQDAARTVAALTGEPVPSGVLKALLARQNVRKNPAAVALGRLGGIKGGKARAASLSPKERREIAQKAAKTRWENAAKANSIKNIEEMLGLKPGSLKTANLPNASELKKPHTVEELLRIIKESGL